MDRIDRILMNDQFIYHMEENKKAEADRRFCRHNMVHFLDVARIGWIMNLEEGLDISREWIYAAALLHDLGRHIQIEEGTPHEEASAVLAPGILAGCGFSQEETCVIVDAVRQHRSVEVREEKNLRGILYRSDKASRACYACEAEGLCNWKEEKKNKRLLY